MIQAWRVSAGGAGEVARYSLGEELQVDPFVSLELLQKIDLKGKIPLEMAMSLLPDSSSEFGALFADS